MLKPGLEILRTRQLPWFDPGKSPLPSVFPPENPGKSPFPSIFPPENPGKSPFSFVFVLENPGKSLFSSINMRLQQSECVAQCIPWKRWKGSSTDFLLALFWYNQLSRINRGLQVKETGKIRKQTKIENSDKPFSINPLHSNISMHILHTVLYTFPKVLIRRTFWTIKSFISWWSFPLFSWPWCVIQGWHSREKLDISHS